MLQVSLTFLVFLPFVFAGFVFAWAHVRMVLHETAHCLAARAVGLHPLQMEWGTSDKGWHFCLFGLPVVWHAQPWDGIVHCQFPSLEGLRWRGAICTLAGTVVDVALLFLILGVNRHAEATLSEPPIWFWISKPLVFVQIFILLVTLMPHDLQIEEWKCVTDGKALFQFLNGSTAEKMRAERDQYLAVMRRYQPDLTLEQCWVYRPNIELLRRHLRAMAAFGEGRFADGLALAEDLLAATPMAPGERAHLLNCMACTINGSKKRWDLQRALVWIREAHELLPEAPSLRGNLGALLAENGDLDEAIPFLHPLTASENGPEERIHACCYLAKVCDQRGDRAEARRWLDKARAIQPNQEIISHMETELGFSSEEP